MGDNEVNESSLIPLFLFPQQSWKHSLFRAIDSIVFIIWNLGNKIYRDSSGMLKKILRRLTGLGFIFQSFSFSSAFVKRIQAFTSNKRILNWCTLISVVQKEPLCLPELNLQIWVAYLQRGNAVAARETHRHIQTNPGHEDNCYVAVPGILGVITLTFFIIVC